MKFHLHFSVSLDSIFLTEQDENFETTHPKLAYQDVLKKFG